MNYQLPNLYVGTYYDVIGDEPVSSYTRPYLIFDVKDSDASKYSFALKSRTFTCPKTPLSISSYSLIHIHFFLLVIFIIFRPPILFYVFVNDI